MPERQPDRSDRAARARREPAVARGAADRHFAAVVAEEIRHLGRSWRRDGLRTMSGGPRGGENPRPKVAF
jgi:hypothetical protein